MSVKKALVVDDSKLARITLKKKLELRAVDVDMAESASEALKYLQSHQPDIIFMDHLMPEIDGFEATRRIKANPATRHIPVIMCTGKEHDGYLQEATAIGASNILSKPPETEALDAILTMDLEPAAAPAMAEPPVLQPIAPAAVARGHDVELIDDSFDADAAFGVEQVAPAADAPVDLIDTSELESLSAFELTTDTSANDGAVLLEGVEGIGSLQDESAMAALDDILGDNLLSSDNVPGSDDVMIGDQAMVGDEVVVETTASATDIDSWYTEPVASKFAVGDVKANAASAAITESAGAKEFKPQHAVPIAVPQLDIAAVNAAVVAQLQKELAQRLVTLRETVIADLTQTLRRQIDDLRDAFGGNSQQQDGRLCMLEQKTAELADTSAARAWVLEKMPPAIDMARLTDDIAARIAMMQTADVMSSDEVISLKARLDEAESELAALRRREAPAPDANALQSLMPALSRQLDTLLQQRVPVIVSDISDQVQLQLAYQMNDGRAQTPAAPSLDKIITSQADIETQLAAMKKQLSDEWTARLQALIKQLKDQLQHAPLPASVDTSALRQQWRDDTRDDIKRALAAFKSQLPTDGGQVEMPAAGNGRIEQMLETVTNQFARTQADYEHKLKQLRLIAAGAVVASVVVSAVMAILL